MESKTQQQELHNDNVGDTTREIALVDEKIPDRNGGEDKTKANAKDIPLIFIQGGVHEHGNHQDG